MERVKKILTNSLLAFALISIGYSLGKHSVKSDNPTNTLPGGKGDYVAVYYLHSTFRCATCNTIEAMTRELLEKTYPDELAVGSIQWIEADFIKNNSLAEQFEVVASCVVIAEIKKGVVTDYKRLDEVWILMQDTEAFNTYVSAAINESLNKNGDQS